ncbi:hypothetical protein Ahy_A03g011640 isoform C [Arachis hypogaea]|uniref:Uncharacterized protein n=1 Tax=Arachis hypogaea TaxID=3818 RepID=A0A445DRB7_ARAHY|nr:hypothetical protein Ahy_A03g011640 isoform C [Arachis hypogaea]
MVAASVIIVVIIVGATISVQITLELLLLLPRIGDKGAFCVKLCDCFIEMLQIISKPMKDIGPRAMFYLAVAVSDFYVPWKDMFQPRVAHFLSSRAVPPYTNMLLGTSTHSLRQFGVASGNSDCRASCIKRMCPSVPHCLHRLGRRSIRVSISFKKHIILGRPLLTRLRYGFGTNRGPL